MKRIAIIPARSGSKGLRDKNIKKMCGKPLLSYSIDAAKESGLFDKIVVSTDSEKYAKVARKYGAEVPFLRSNKNATDTASSWDVVREVLDRYAEMGEKYDSVCLLQPTSPLRNNNHIRESYQLFDSRDANAVISVSQTDHSPLLTNTLSDTLDMKGFLSDEICNTPRQLLPLYYSINGAVYIVRTDYLYEMQNIYGSRCFAYIMDKRMAVDIDDDKDFYIAEYWMKLYRHKKGR